MQYQHIFDHFSLCACHLQLSFILFFVWLCTLFCHQHHQLHRLSFERKTLYIFYWNIFRTYFFFVLIIMIPNAFLKRRKGVTCTLHHIDSFTKFDVYFCLFICLSELFPGWKKNGSCPKLTNLFTQNLGLFFWLSSRFIFTRELMLRKKKRMLCWMDWNK